MPETPSSTYIAGGILLAIALFIAHKPYIHELLTPDGQVMLVPPCDLQQGACTASWGEISLILSLNPIPLMSLKPIDVSLELKGAPAERSARLVLQGTEMYMGETRSSLSSQPDTPDFFKGTTSLSMCIDSDMLWRATVYIETPDQLYAAHFDFRAQ